MSARQQMAAAIRAGASAEHDAVAEARFRKQQKRKRLRIFVRLHNRATGHTQRKQPCRQSKAGGKPNCSAQAVQRRVKRAVKHVGTCLRKAEMHENKVPVSRSGQILHSNPSLRKPCGGLAIYQPASGPAVVSATSMVQEAMKATGAMQRIKRIAEDNGFSSDGGRNDPSLLTVLKHVLEDLIGERSEQGEYHVESGDVLYILWSSHILFCNDTSFCCVAGLCYAI